MYKANQVYVQTQVSTVNQGELLVLLYDAALKFLAQAREKILAKDYAAKGLLISKALDVITELDGSLNQEAGGDLAQNLHQLYFLCSSRLLQANLRLSVELLDSVVTILSGLRNAYAQIVNTPEARAAAAQIATKHSSDASLFQRAAPLPQPSAFGGSRSAAQSAYAQMGMLAQQPPALQTTQSQAGATPNQPAEQLLPPPVSPTAIPPLNLENRRLAATARYGKMAQGE